MNETPLFNRRNSDGASNFWRLLEVIALYRRLVLTLVLIGTLGSVAYAFIAPEWFRAEALLLPPKEDRIAVSSMGTGIAEWASVTGGLNLPLMVTPSDVYVRMLSSRTAIGRVIDSFNLLAYYDVHSLTDAQLTVRERLDARVTPEGLIRVSFEDQDPRLAAEIANAFVAELDKIVREIFVTRTRQSREFIEKSLEKAGANLDSARTRLRSFQEENHTIDLDQQTSLAINTASGLMAELGSSEVELALKLRTLSESHPEVTELRLKVNELKKKISELEQGTADSSYFSLPVAEAPRLRAELAALTTQVRVAEQLFENLSIQLDQVRVQENREAPAIPALDMATVPEIRYWPQRTLIVAVTTALSFVLAVLLALFFDYLAGLEQRRPEDFRRAQFFFKRFFLKEISIGKRGRAGNSGENSSEE